MLNIGLHKRKCNLSRVRFLACSGGSSAVIRAYTLKNQFGPHVRSDYLLV